MAVNVRTIGIGKTISLVVSMEALSPGILSVLPSFES